MFKKSTFSLVLALSLLLTMVSIAQASPNVIFKGQQLKFDVPPVIEDGRTLVPLRAIFEAMGANVNWDEATQTVTGTTYGTEVKLQIGSQTAYVNGKPITIDVVGKIINGRTLVPLRFVSEALGAKVAWNADTQTAEITPSDGQAGTAQSTNQSEQHDKGDLLNNPDFISNAATVLGMTADQIKADLQSGQTLLQIITTQGMTMEQFSQKMPKRLHDSNGNSSQRANFFDNAATVLGMTADELKAAIKSGKKLDQIVTEKGMTMEEFRQKMPQRQNTQKAESTSNTSTNTTK